MVFPRSPSKLLARGDPSPGHPVSGAPSTPVPGAGGRPLTLEHTVLLHSCLCAQFALGRRTVFSALGRRALFTRRKGLSGRKAVVGAHKIQCFSFTFFVLKLGHNLLSHVGNT